MKFACSILGLMALIILGVAPVQATVVTSLPDGTIIDMPVVNYFGPGPQVFGPEITWSSTNQATDLFGSVFGYNGPYGFGGNGSWDGIVMAGLNSSFDLSGAQNTMMFEFNTPVYAVGGYLNYLPGGSTPTTIAVYDVDGGLLEDLSLTFLTDPSVDNPNVFYGFREASPIIGSFALTDNYIGISDLTIVSPVPEPASIVLFGPGLCVLGFASLRRKQK